ncbi:MAG TPA: DUF2304 domain-containing protein [Bryobacteraceae bacterium]|nr:DUF2304 domain-containing protein [Bryobacteraceae bacterium]
MERLLNVIAVFSVLLIVFVLASVRRAHIRVEYSVSWLIAGVVLLVLSRWQALGRWITAALGMNDAPLALLSVAGAIFLVVLYRFSLIISRLKDSNIALTQRVAILEFRLTSLDEKKKSAAGD